MTRSRLEVPVPRVALSYREAAAAMGKGETWWKANVLPYVRVVRIGGECLVPVSELERFLVERAEPILREAAA